MKFCVAPEKMLNVCFVFWHQYYLLSLLLLFVLASRNWRYNVTLIAFRCCLSRIAVCVGFFGCFRSFWLLFSLFMGHITETERFVGVVNVIREAIAQFCLSCPSSPSLSLPLWLPFANGLFIYLKKKKKIINFKTRQRHELKPHFECDYMVDIVCICRYVEGKSNYKQQQTTRRTERCCSRIERPQRTIVNACVPICILYLLYLYLHCVSAEICVPTQSVNN